MVHVSLCQKIAPFLPSASKPDLCQEFNNQVRCLAGAELCSETFVLRSRGKARLLKALAETIVMLPHGSGSLASGLLVLPLSNCDWTCVTCLLHILDCYVERQAPREQGFCTAVSVPFG